MSNDAPILRLHNPANRRLGGSGASFRGAAMSEHIDIRKEDHPLWHARILDPEQVIPGTYRRIHCLPARGPESFFSSWVISPSRPALVLDYLVEVTSTPYQQDNDGFSLRVDTKEGRGFYLSDAGVVPYGSGHYNESNFLVSAFSLDGIKQASEAADITQ